MLEFGMKLNLTLIALSVLIMVLIGSGIIQVVFANNVTAAMFNGLFLGIILASLINLVVLIFRNK